jgi:hypothetical protein
MTEKRIENVFFDSGAVPSALRLINGSVLSSNPHLSFSLNASKKLVSAWVDAIHGFFTYNGVVGCRVISFRPKTPFNERESCEET